MNNFQYNIQFNVNSTNVTVAVRNCQNSINSLNRSISNSLAQISTALSNIEFGAITDMVKNTAEAFSSLSNAGVEFEQSMTEFKAITGLAGDEFERIRDIARQTGKETGLGAKGAAEAFTLLASQIDTSAIGLEGLIELQRETITLSQAGGLSMQDAATAMAATINQYGMAATEASRVINVLAAGSKYGAAEVNDLTQSLKVAGGTASSAGVSLESTAGALEVLAAANIKGSESGTALRNIILKMQTELGYDLGEIPLAVALERLKPKLNDVNFLTETFGIQNVNAAQYLIRNAEAVHEMTEAVTGTNTAQEQAAIRTDTTAAKMAQFRAEIDDIKISFFDATKGVAAYASVAGDVAVTVAQTLPLFMAMGNAIKVMTSQSARATVASVAHSAAMKAGAVATGIISAATAVYNAVLAANPVAMVVLAIGALVAILIAAYNKSETFRNIVDRCWEAIKRFAAIIFDGLVRGFKAAFSWIGKVVDKVKAFLGIESKAAGETENLTEKIDGETRAVKKLDQQYAEQAKKIPPIIEKKKKLREEENKNLETLGGISNKIKDLQEAQLRAFKDQAIALEKEIDLWKKRQKVMEETIAIAAHGAVALEALNVPNQVSTPKPVTVPNSIDAWTKSRVEAESNAAAIDKQYQGYMKMSKLVMEYSGHIGDLGHVMQSLSGIVGEGAASWLQWGANLFQVISEAIPQIFALANATTTATIQEMAGREGVAATSAAASVASVPYAGPVLAVAAALSVIAALAAIPRPKKLATGGLAYGSVLANVGEYPGASNNPEVIAPLSKLRDLIQPAGEGMDGHVTFEISGRVLKGILRKVENSDRRTS